ncbi:hypothetical protein RF11_09693 [Thelohanellus kitauei]|uniref:Uncharacterized protein n=1 Tax=Thelohanellus kitauei TaxID=669202 RepID=A0A0C2N213_THEKT|nr:hypothetical protein RF11_09693 [Thelohanellus kitauei]
MLIKCAKNGVNFDKNAVVDLVTFSVAGQPVIVSMFMDSHFGSQKSSICFLNCSDMEVLKEDTSNNISEKLECENTLQDAQQPNHEMVWQNIQLLSNYSIIIASSNKINLCILRNIILKYFRPREADHA